MDSATSADFGLLGDELGFILGDSPVEELDAGSNPHTRGWSGPADISFACRSCCEFFADGATSGLTCSTLPCRTTTTYTSDGDGNIITSTSSSPDTSYTFDLDNRLVQAVTPAGTTTFSYDGLGDRIRETGPSGAQTYTDTVVASGDAMLYLRANVSGTLTKTAYLYAGSLLVATVSGMMTSYVHEDALGDTRLVTQKPHSSVVVVFSTNYLPFGIQYAASGTDPSIKYTGQWDEALGLYWDHARFYDPTLGRFVSADPVLGHLSTPQTLDRYAYAVNDPMRFEDPSGRDCSWNPLSWGDCLGAAGNAISGWWNGLSAGQKGLVVGLAAAVLVTAACLTIIACVPAIGIAGVMLAGGAASAGAYAIGTTAFGGTPTVGGALIAFGGGVAVSGLILTGVSEFLGPEALMGGGSTATGGTVTGGATAALESADGGELEGEMDELPPGVANSFQGTPTRLQLTEDWQGYQYGNGPGYESNWATPTRYTDPAVAQDELSLPEYNSASMVRSVTVPKGTVLWQGIVSPTATQTGLGQQVYVLDRSSMITGPWVPTFGG